MHKTFFTGCILGLALVFSPFYLRAEDSANLAPNPGFEDADLNASYYLGVSGDSKAMNVRYALNKQTVHSGTQSVLVQADDFARCSVGPKVPIHPLTPGERYRVGVWVKAGADFQAQSGTPGVVLRMNPAQGFPPVAGMTIFVNLDGTVSSGIAPPAGMKPLSTDWTHIEAVIEVPANIDSMGPVLFLWKAKGSLYVDDFTFVKVDPTTPLSPTAAAGTPQ